MNRMLLCPLGACSVAGNQTSKQAEYYAKEMSGCFGITEEGEIPPGEAGEVFEEEVTFEWSLEDEAGFSGAIRVGEAHMLFPVGGAVENTSSGAAPLQLCWGQLEWPYHGHTS